MASSASIPGQSPRGRGASIASNLIDAMNHDAASLTHVTRRVAPLPLGIGALRCTRIGMRACADTHGLLRACLEDASSRPLGLDLANRRLGLGSRGGGDLSNVFHDRPLWL